MRRVQRGYLLLMVVSLGGLMWLTAFTAVKISSQSALQEAFHDRGVSAITAADTALAEAADQLSRDPQWTGELQSDAPGGATYSLSFGPTDSFNNVDGTQAVTHLGRQVPTGCVLLLAHGKNAARHVQSAAICSPERLVFQDEFDTSLAGWEGNGPGLDVLLLGAWLVDVSLGQKARVLKGDETWRNYEFETTVLLSQGSGLNLLVRASGDIDSPTSYVLGYNLLEAPLAGGTFYLDRMENGVRTERIQTRRASDRGILGGLPWLLNLYHTYRVTVVDDRVILAVDGVRLIDSRVSDPIANGRVGIEPGLNAVMLVDRVSVRALPEVRSRWRNL